MDCFVASLLAMTTPALSPAGDREHSDFPQSSRGPPSRADERRRQQDSGARSARRGDSCRRPGIARDPSRPRLDFDQLMALTDPAIPRPPRFVRIYNNDGTEAGACGNGTRCVADRLARQSGAQALTIETAAGRSPASGSAPGPSASIWARRGSPGTKSRWRRKSPTRAGSTAPARRGAGLRAGERRQYGQSACDLLGRGRRCGSARDASGRASRPTRCFRKRPISPSRKFARAIRSR